MSVSAGAQVIIDPVAPVSNMASVEVGWIEVVVTGRLIWHSFYVLECNITLSMMDIRVIIAFIRHGAKC